MNRPLSSTSWKFWGNCHIGPSRCQSVIRSHCITVSLFTITWAIICMVFGELWLRSRPSGMKTCNLRWRMHGRCCPNIMLKSPQQQVCFIFRHITSILSTTCNRSQGGTREWVSIPRMRLHIPLNTSVSNGSGYPTSGPGFDRRFGLVWFGLVWFQTRPKTRPALSWRVCYPDRTYTRSFLAGFYLQQSLIFANSALWLQLSI